MDRASAPDGAGPSVWERILDPFRRLLRPVRRRLPFKASVPRLTMPPPGTVAGIEPEELSRRSSSEEPVHVTCIDYSPEKVQVQEVTDTEAFIATHRPEWSQSPLDQHRRPYPNGSDSGLCRKV